MRKLVLVVEDENPIQKLLVDILEEAAYNVQTARFGKEVMVKAKKALPDLILLDIMLPDLDGNGVLSLLGNDVKLSKVPVIVLSAYPQLLKNSPQVRAVITKPFDIVDLLDEVEKNTSLGYGTWPLGFDGDSIQHSGQLA